MKSLQLTMLWERDDGEQLPCLHGTGFTVMREGIRYLITNLHNFRGMSREGEVLTKHGVTPTHVRIDASNNLFPGVGRVQLVEALFSTQGGTPLWLQHPKGVEFDVAALPITRNEGVGLMPAANGYEAHANVLAGFYDWTIPGAEEDGSARPYLRPADTVSIVGFPFGFRSHDGMPIWITGTIASEPEFDYDHRPIFLVDARTREGQSGSPVVLHLTPNSTGVLFSDDTVRAVVREKSFFLGIYSGRLNQQSDLGIVWKPQAIRDLLEQAAPVHRE